MKTIAGFVFLGIALITCGAASHTDGCDSCGGGYRAYTSYAPAMMVAPAMPCADLHDDRVSVNLPNGLRPAASGRLSH